MIDFTHIFFHSPPGPQQPMACQRCYLRRGVFKVAQISALCAQQDAPAVSTGGIQSYYSPLALSAWSHSPITVLSPPGIGCERNESVAARVSVRSGVDCSRAACDVPGRGARRFYFWWVASGTSSTFTHTNRLFCETGGGGGIDFNIGADTRREKCHGKKVTVSFYALCIMSRMCAWCLTSDNNNGVYDALCITCPRLDLSLRFSVNTHPLMPMRDKNENVCFQVDIQ